MTEKELQTKFILFLERNKILHYKTHGGMVRQFLPIKRRDVYGKEYDYYQPFKLKSGFSDIILFLDGGLTYHIELKSDTGILKESQKENREMLMKKGHQYWVLRPKHWELFKQEFKRVKKLEEAKIHDTHLQGFSVKMRTPINVAITVALWETLESKKV